MAVHDVGKSLQICTPFNPTRFNSPSHTDIGKDIIKSDPKDNEPPSEAER